MFFRTTYVVMGSTHALNDFCITIVFYFQSSIHKSYVFLTFASQYYALSLAYQQVWLQVRNVSQHITTNGLWPTKRSELQVRLLYGSHCGTESSKKGAGPRDLQTLTKRRTTITTDLRKHPPSEIVFYLRCIDVHHHVRICRLLGLV